jgi:hypothetical protein
LMGCGEWLIANRSGFQNVHPSFRLIVMVKAMGCLYFLVFFNKMVITMNTRASRTINISIFGSKNIFGSKIITFTPIYKWFIRLLLIKYLIFINLYI